MKELNKFASHQFVFSKIARYATQHFSNYISICFYMRKNDVRKKKIENQIIDTIALAREKFPGSSLSLDALCRKYRIDNSKRTQHSALVDCDLLAKVYINLIDQKEPTLDFQKLDYKPKEFQKDKIFYFKKIIKPTTEDLKKHKDFLSKDLKKNFFN